MRATQRVLKKPLYTLGLKTLSLQQHKTIGDIAHRSLTRETAVCEKV
jgi:hypothetical protein